jgi:two-component system response regulator CpxR
MTDSTETVLIVEDEARLARMYAGVLRATYTVRTAPDGETALALADDAVDAVLLDRRLPTLSGREVLEQLRARGDDTPVAMLTAVTPDWDVIEMGFDDYLLKPVDSAGLERAVERLLALGALDPAVREHVRQSITQAALEGTKSPDDLDESEAFAALADEVTDGAVELGDVTAELSPRETELVVESITRNLGPPDDSGGAEDPLAGDDW